MYYVSKNIKKLTDQLSLRNKGGHKRMRRREKWILEEYLDKGREKIVTAKLRSEKVEHQNHKIAYSAYERKKVNKADESQEKV